MKALALGALLVVAAAACGTPAGAVFKTTAIQPDGSYPMPVALGDLTGLVVAIESAMGEPAGAFDEPSVRQDPNDAKAVILTFFTGACDDDAAVSFRRSDTGFVLRVDVREGFSLGGCTAQLLIRGLRIRLSEPVTVDSIAALGIPS
jgi:hypothetical protein